MIGYFMYGTNNLKKSSKFYDSFLSEIEMVKVEDENEFIGYAKKDDPKRIIFYLTLPFDGGKASFGNGTMVAFKVSSQKIVDNVHELAIKNGAINEGNPGVREGYDNMYFSYFRDLDYNKICVYSELSDISKISV